MAASTNLERFTHLLRELFQFDVADLDFGVYRILNEKRDDIECFIDNDLVAGVREELEAFEEGQREALEEKVEDARQAVLQNVSEDAVLPDGSVREGLKDLGLSAVDAYIQARDRLDALELAEETEERIYDDLVRFFNRYYESGDFVTKRRFAAGTSKYYMPYDGEEVLLHWANRDQYYVKTTEHFRDYRFSIRDVDVHFKLIEAETPQDNVKASDTRYFVLQGESPVTVDTESDVVEVRFAFRMLSKTEEEELLSLYNQTADKSRKTSDRSTVVLATTQKILREISDATTQAKLEEPEIEGEKRPLQKHLNRYTAKHTSDYFIHKDLAGFLKEQLSFYIQNEVLKLRDVLEASETRKMHQVGRARAVQKIGERVINFLAQIENFQKRLFEKKKFVVESGYCVTLDQVPESLYDAILACEPQLDEWTELYAIDQWEDGLFNQGYEDATFTREFLEGNPHVMIDTRHFSVAFIDELLAHLSGASDEGLAGQVEGLCINSENYQALRLLQDRYREKIDCVYIDPPYNSNSSEILYKNTYKHSSWLSLMDDRLSLGRGFLKADGVQVVAIDENEQERLGSLLSESFPGYDSTCVTVEHNPRGVQGDNFSYTHEYAYFIFPEEGSYIRQQILDESEWEYSNLRNWGGESRREDGKSCFYPIYVENGSITELGEVPAEGFHPAERVESVGNGIKVWPIDREGIERKWRYKADSLREVLDTVRVRTVSGEREIEIARSRATPRTVWSGSRFDAGTHGSRYLSNRIGKENMPEESVFPKSIHTLIDSMEITLNTQENGQLVMDYFAGSGTTADSIIRLNKENGTVNGYVLVEMGDYFGGLLMPRLKKTVFANEWSDGVPQSKDGISHVIQYHRLESYEDALNNIKVEAPEGELDLQSEFGDYALQYMLDTETAGSDTLLTTDAFEKPFDYTLQIQHGMESPKTHPVDLEATFNYLIGLSVHTRVVYEHQGRRYVVVTGTVEQEQSIEDVMVVWRDQDDLDLSEEKTWAAETLPEGPFDRVYVNGPSHIHGKAEPLEIVFRERMDPAAG